MVCSLVVVWSCGATPGAEDPCDPASTAYDEATCAATTDADGPDGQHLPDGVPTGDTATGGVADTSPQGTGDSVDADSAADGALGLDGAATDDSSALQDVDPVSDGTALPDAAVVTDGGVLSDASVVDDAGAVSDGVSDAGPIADGTGPSDILWPLDGPPDDGAAAPLDGSDGSGEDAAASPCVTAAECDDGNVCTDDSCDPVSGCEHMPNTLECAVSACAAGAFTPSAFCSGGVCPPQSPETCDDGQICTDDGCDLLAGCVHAFNTAECAPGHCEGLTFFGSATCDMGACPAQTGLLCEDGEVCTDDACDAGSGCVYANNSAPCAASECVEGEIFSPPRACVGGVCPAPTEEVCDDGQSCTDDSCDLAGGCLHTPNTKPCAAAKCEDGAFYAPESCQAGSCPVATPQSCDDQDACTDDWCDPETGCEHASNTAQCASAKCEAGAYFAAAVCVGGMCPAQVAEPCDDSNPCTNDSCSPVSGCKHTNNTAQCSAGSCQGGEFIAAYCQAGSCGAPSGKTCDDGQWCNGSESCDPSAGCKPGASPAVGDGVPCTTDTCDESQDIIVHTPVDSACDDKNPCTSDSCDVTQGCGHANIDGSCSDGNACTTSDACNAGKCAGAPLDCDDGDICTADSCDPVSGCKHEASGGTPAAPQCGYKGKGSGKDKSEMCRVAPGCFMMGCGPVDPWFCEANELPYHKVNVPEYFIDRTEITVGNYNACRTAGACTDPKTGPYCNWDKTGKSAHPVNCVTWAQMDAYCAWTGKRLCSESEWEKAARGTDERNYPWGNQEATCEYAVMGATDMQGMWYGCGTNSTWSVGTKPKGDSPYGVHDMAGNVFEWVQDPYHDTYKNAPVDGSSWDFWVTDAKVIRGGAFYDSYGSLKERSSGRIGLPPPFSAEMGAGGRCCVSQ